MLTAYKAKQKELAEKYQENIEGLATYNNVDMGVAFDMLVSNAKQMIAGKVTDYYKGGGKLDFDQLIEDVLDLEASRGK